MLRSMFCCSLVMTAGVLLAVESVPYFQVEPYRSAWTSDRAAPTLHRVDDVAGLKALPVDAVAIEMDDPRVEMWTSLKARPGLEELHLPRGFAPELKELSSLKRIFLQLRGTEAPEAVAEIGKLRPGEFLYLSFERVSVDDILKFAQTLPVVEVPLRLFIGSSDGAKLPNALLEAFSKQTRLEFAHFNSETFEPGAGKILASWPALKYLYTLECPGFDNSTCNELAASLSLEALNGVNHQFDGAGLFALANIKTLRHLGMKGIIKANHGQIVAALKKLTLESLVIEMEEFVDEAVFKQVMAMKTLQMLRLPVADKISPETFEKLSSLKELRWLALTGYKLGRPFDAISSLKNLRHLFWPGTNTPPAALFKKLPAGLRLLHLQMEKLTEEHLKYIAKLKALEDLSIGATTELSSKAILQLADIKSLKRLRVAWSGDARSDFAEARPDVDIGSTG